MLEASFNREDVGRQAAAVAAMLLGKIANGSIEVKSADVAGLLQVLVTITRLEEGLSTSNHTHLSVTGEAVLERIERLRAQHAATVSGGADETIEATVVEGGEG